MAARKKKSGPTTLKGSVQARKTAAMILEALSGEIGTTEAAERLGISHSRYYQLEGRALTAMLAAMEPRPRGRVKTPEGEIKALEAQKRTLEKELRRHQSLLRAANRSLGLAGRARKKASSKARRKKRKGRGKTVLQTLRRGLDEVKGEGDGTAKRDAEPGGSGAGESGSA